MKRTLLLLTFCISVVTSGYGQFALHNTRTLFDTFESPSQKAFYADSSKKYAFNFLVPTISFNGTFSGEAQTPLKNLLYNGKFDSRGLTLGENRVNKITLTENSYLATWKVFKSVKFHREMGVAWQIKSDTYGEIPNETLAIFNNYRLFNSASFSNPLNSQILTQSYHQFSFTYREDYTRRFGLGVKIGYLSGIAHTRLRIDSSVLNVQKELNSYNMSLYGSYRSNTRWDSAETSLVYPGFKNPGLALSVSANYKMKGGWYVLGNLKDLGFIRWSKADSYEFKDAIAVTGATASQANSSLRSGIRNLIDKSEKTGYTTMINGKAEFLINKDLGVYQPNLLISKNLFYKGGDIALVNRLNFDPLNVSVTSAYNLNNFFQLGAQLMLKSPNTEFFIGSDQLLKSYYTTKGFLTSNEMIGKGNTAASVYFGLAFKYGGRMERQQNATVIPGLDDKVKRSFFQRIFKKKSKS